MKNGDLVYSIIFDRILRFGRVREVQLNESGEPVRYKVDWWRSAKINEFFKEAKPGFIDSYLEKPINASNIYPVDSEMLRQFTELLEEVKKDEINS